jgi:N-acetylglutamate synthase
MMIGAADSRADRLQAALSTTFEGFFGALGEASFERRVGHVRLLFPAVPIHVFNGVVVETEPCDGIADSIREVEEHGLPCGVQVRAGRHPGVDEEAATLGLTARVPMPGMSVSPDEFVDRPAPDLEIVPARDEEGLREAADASAAGFSGSLEAILPLYSPSILELTGFTVYLGRIDGETVTTAMGYQTVRDVAIFSVATHPRHRRRGYGAAITAQAARDGFANGSDLAWLQTSDIGESVYRGLGFRHVEMHLMLRRPGPGTP